jgi:hypothetical protein
MGAMACGAYHRSPGERGREARVIANTMRRMAAALPTCTWGVAGGAAEIAAPPAAAASAPGSVAGSRLPLEHFARLPLIADMASRRTASVSRP